MFETGGIDIEGAGFDAELSAGLAPSGDNDENIAENHFCFGGFEAEAGCGVECCFEDGRFLILRDRGLGTNGRYVLYDRHYVGISRL